MHCRFRTFPSSIAMLTFAAFFAPGEAAGWGVHDRLTQAAVELLPDWQRAWIKAEEGALVRRYCVFPDFAGDVDAKPYILPFLAEEKISLHIPGQETKHRQLFDAYLSRTMASLKTGETADALRWFGCVAHFLEDSAAPCHMRFGELKFPEDGPPLLQMDFFKRFLPVSEMVDQQMLHSTIDNCPLTVEQLRQAVAGYRPRLLGHNLEEAIFHLLEAHLDANRQGSRQVFPMLVALNANDETRFVACGVEAAAAGTRVVADLLYTMLCLARQRFETRPATEASLADRTPAESSPFSWSDRNHQGRLIPNASGAVHSNMSEPKALGRHALRLKMADGSVREFAKGYGVGWRSEFTFLVPRGVYQTFSVYAGNDAQLGGDGTNRFEVLLDGQPAAATATMKGAVAAERLEVPLNRAAAITLRCTSEGPPSKTHGVWAEPRLTGRNPEGF